MNSEGVVFVFSMFLPWISTQRESCVTPLGQPSQCIELDKCSLLSDAFKIQPLPSDVAAFLRQSQCGFKHNILTICCGPLPPKTNTSPQTTQRIPTDGHEGWMGAFEPVNNEDSQPAPRGHCGLNTNGNRIYGGIVTDLDEFPWMSRLCYQTLIGIKACQCGGALINHRYVVTAAHCLVGAIEKHVGELVSVRLGEYDINTAIDCLDGVCADPPQDILVQAKYPHPNYNDENRKKRDDIGLVRLAKRAKFTYYVQPICLVVSGSRQNIGSNMIVAGWGKTLNGKISPVKLKVSLPLYDQNECVKKYRIMGMEISESQICAGGNLAEDSCSGDSGGPLMRSGSDGVWEAVGVVSFGYGCGRKGWPGIYTSVAGYLDWILDTLKSTNT